MEENLSEEKINDAIAVLSEAELKKVPILSFAYVGDCVFEMYIRMIAAAKLFKNAANAHKFTVSFVNAGAQSKMAQHLLENGIYTEAEADVFRRGRNAKPGSVPKNADVADYHRATGFEAVLGYLYMSGERERALILCEKAFESVKDEIK